MLRDIDKYVRWSPQQGKYLPVYWRKEVLPSWLYFDVTDNPAGVAVTVPALAGGTSVNTVFKQPYTSLEGLDRDLGWPFLVKNLMFTDLTDTTALADFTVMLKDVGAGRTFMNAPCHIRTLAGVAQTPAILREPYMFRSLNNIAATFKKISGGATTAKMYLGGSQYYPWSPALLGREESRKEITDLLRKWYVRSQSIQPFWLTTDTPAVLTAGQTLDFNTQIGDDGHVQVFTVAAVATGSFAWQITEVKTRQTLMNGNVTLSNSIGTANFPTLLPTPYLIPAGYRVIITLTDLSGAGNTIFLTLGGRKIYAPISDIEQAPLTDNTSVPTSADNRSLMVPAPLGPNS